MNEKNIRFRTRVCSDILRDISVYDSPYFDYQLTLYHPYNDSLKNWCFIRDLIEKHYNSNEELFMEDYYKCRNNIITNIENLNAYKMFISRDNVHNVNDNINNIKYSSISRSSVYIEPNDEKFFLSIDLKHANFQGLKFFSSELVNNCDCYEDFIETHIGKTHPLLEYFKMSKYTRQIIFGKLNMTRNISIQNYIIYLIWNIICNIIENGASPLKIYSKNSDELIFEIDGDWADVKKFITTFEERVKNLKVRYNLNIFKLNLHKFALSNDRGTISVYEKKSVDNKTFILEDIYKIKQCPSIYFPQVYKILNNIPLDYEHDLTFYYNNQLARFLEPITLIEK
jgi:hypothetical protein